MSFTHYIPTKIIFGNGRLKKLNKQKLPGKKAMIVTQKALMDLGIVERVTSQLDEMKIEYTIFDKVVSNPTYDNVMEGAETAKAGGCDFLLAVGGGSSIDAAKSISVMVNNEGDFWDYISDGTGRGMRPKNAPMSVVCIATTPGTGSEADCWSVITKKDTEEKVNYGYNAMFPVLSIVDPEVMQGIPADFTAYQGFDALFHSAEGYVCKVANHLSDMYALTAIEKISQNLLKTIENGDDLEARENVAFGSTLGGLVMSCAGTSSQHSLEHALSASHPELPHGAGLIMLSKAFFTRIANSGACDERMIRMAKAMGKADATKAMDFVDALVELEEACGVADLKMSDYGIKKEDLPEYAKNARVMGPGLFMIDRVPLTDEDSLAILEASYK